MTVSGYKIMHPLMHMMFASFKCSVSIEWPPRPPDFTPLGFYIVLFKIKKKVYVDIKLNPQKDRIRDELKGITPEVIYNV